MITELLTWTVGQFLPREVEVAKQTTVTHAPDGRQRGTLPLDAEPPGGFEWAGEGMDPRVPYLAGP